MPTQMHHPFPNGEYGLKRDRMLSPCASEEIFQNKLDNLVSTIAFELFDNNFRLLHDCVEKGFMHFRYDFQSLIDKGIITAADDQVFPLLAAAINEGFEAAYELCEAVDEEITYRVDHGPDPDDDRFALLSVVVINDETG